MQKKLFFLVFSLQFSNYIIKMTNICSQTFQVSEGDVGAERNVQAGANSDPRGEM